MAQRVAAIFDSREAAERAANALVDLGADREYVSMLARGEEGHIATTTPALGERDHTDIIEPAREVGDTGAPLTTADDEDAAHGAATGAAIGAVAGLAAGAMALMVPGFGLVMAAGPLAWALGGAAGTAAAGAIAGGIYGGLHDIGIEEHHARGYEERLRGGDVLVTALVPSVAEERVLDVLAEHGAEDVSFADDTAISQMDERAAETRIAADQYPAAPRRDYDAAERDIATADPAHARMDVPPPVPSTGTNIAAPGIGGVTGAATGATAPVAPRTARADYNEEASPAEKVTTTRQADTSFEASTARPGYAQTPMNARENTETVPSATSTTNYQSQNPNADTASYAESPIGAAATTGAAFDSHVAEGQAKEIEGEIKDRAADRTASPVDDLAAKGEKLEGRIQRKLGEAEETIEPRRR